MNTELHPVLKQSLNIHFVCLYNLFSSSWRVVCDICIPSTRNNTKLACNHIKTHTRSHTHSQREREIGISSDGGNLKLLASSISNSKSGEWNQERILRIQSTNRLKNTRPYIWSQGLRQWPILMPALITSLLIWRHPNAMKIIWIKQIQQH